VSQLTRVRFFFSPGGFPEVLTLPISIMSTLLLQSLAQAEDSSHLFWSALATTLNIVLPSATLHLIPKPEHTVISLFYWQGSDGTLFLIFIF
jgi:hypothetical protein